MSDNIKDTLYDLAKKGFMNAYTPYSKYNVGACLITNDSRAFVGSNIENVSFGATICAERSCLFSAYSNGVRQKDIKAFALISDSKELQVPCGICLQVMHELLNEETPIYIFNLKGDCSITNMDLLLPYYFTGLNENV